MITIGLKEIFDLCQYSSENHSSSQYQLNELIENIINKVIESEICNKSYICKINLVSSLYENKDDYILSSVEKQQFEKHQRHLQNVKESYRKYVRKAAIAWTMSDLINSCLIEGIALTPQQLKKNEKWFKTLLLNLKTIHNDGIIDLNQD